MKREYVAVIQAGGKGTRMRDLTHDRIPKPLLKLNDKPMIEWQLLSLREFGIKEFVFIVGHLGNMIEEYFGNGEKWGVNISYIKEQQPLGSAGALYYAKEIVGDKDVIFIFGDVMFELDWQRFIEYHEKKRGIVTLLAHPNSHPYDSDLLLVKEDGKVIGIDSKNNTRDYYYSNCVNAGLSIFSNKLLEHVKNIKKIDYETELVAPLMDQGSVYAYYTPEYVKDVGTPQRFLSACEEQHNGVWNAKCLRNKQKAIFLDRDGTLNYYVGFLRDIEQFKLLPNVSKAVANINSSEFLAIVATNQPVIARGEVTIGELDNIHKKLETELGLNGAYINDIFYCPHHPDKGFAGEIEELKIKCKCRKPRIGMIEEAAKKYNIDLSESWYIGDTTVDIQTGVNAGMKTILLMTGEAGEDKKYNVKPTAIKQTLQDAVDFILKET